MLETTTARTAMRRLQQNFVSEKTIESDVPGFHHPFLSKPRTLLFRITFSPGLFFTRAQRA